MGIGNRRLVRHSMRPAEAASRLFQSELCKPHAQTRSTIVDRDSATDTDCHSVRRFLPTQDHTSGTNGTFVRRSAENKRCFPDQIGTKVTSGFGEASAIIE